MHRLIGNNSPKRNCHINGQLVFDRGANHSKRKGVFSIKHWEHWISTWKRSWTLTLYKNELKSKLKTNINLSAKTINPFQENKANLYDIGLGRVISWIWHQKHREEKKKIGKLHFMKLKTFMHQRTLPTMERNNFQKKILGSHIIWKEIDIPNI